MLLFCYWTVQMYWCETDSRLSSTFKITEELGQAVNCYQGKKFGCQLGKLCQRTHCVRLKQSPRCIVQKLALDSSCWLQNQRKHVFLHFENVICGTGLLDGGLSCCAIQTRLCFYYPYRRDTASVIHTWFLRLVHIGRVSKIQNLKFTVTFRIDFTLLSLGKI